MPRQPLLDQPLDHRLAEAELVHHVADLRAPAERLERLVELPPPRATLEERSSRSISVGGSPASVTTRSVAVPPAGVRWLDLEARRRRPRPAGATHPTPAAAAPARDRRDGRLPAALLQPVEHLAGDAADVPPAGSPDGDHLRLAPEPAGQHALSVRPSGAP